MIDKDFFIYTDRSKLQTPSSTEFRIQKLLNAKQLKPAIKECKAELDLEGAQAIFKNFDKLFSVIEFVDQIDYPTLHFVYDEILVKSLNIIESFFLSYGIIDDIPSDMKQQLTNIIKMTVYLFVEFVLSFNAKIETDYKLLLLETKGRNKKQDMIQKHSSDYDWNWEDKLCNGLQAINNIFSNDITQLYDPPYIDHTFVTYVASCCYTQLESPSIAFVRTKSFCDTIMQTLITFITNYDHANDFKIKTVQLLKLYEHLSLPLAKTVIKIVESGNNRASLIELIVKEIAETGVMEGLKEASNQDITGGKSCCAFLVEIAKHCPNLLLPNIDHLLPCLDSDPYTMRICVLSVLKELIIHVLNNDDLNELEQKTRDDYLNIMLDHTMDVNAFVRSKTLQLLSLIVNENCLPKKMYQVILDCAVEKLHDKSSYVTKSAIQLIKTLIKLNPFSCDFSDINLQNSLNAKKNELKNMEQVLEIKMYGKTNKEEMWLSIESPLKSFLDSTFESNSLELCGKPEKFQNMEISNVLMKIKNHITLHKFDLAIKFIVNGKETFKNEPLFNFIINDESDLSELFFSLLKKIWWYESSETSKVSDDIDKYEQMTAEELSSKIYSVESKINYLQDCTEYLHSIKKSLNTISQLMFGNTSSESLEAIDFFTTAYMFGVSHTQVGIDAMLTLIYSPDASIKEAMMNAYKTIYLDIKDANDSTSRPATIMIKLINLVKTLNVSNRKAFKVLLCEWIKNKTLNDDFVTILWAWFTKSIKISNEDRIVATLLISMIASAKPSIVKGNIDNLIQYGLCGEDYELFIYTCQILEQMVDENFQRFAGNHEMTHRIINITQNCFNKCDIQVFNDVALNAINVIYKLTNKPDVTCMALIRKLYASLENNKNDTIGHKKNVIQVDINLLAKFIFIIGHVALQQYNHLENYISKELIRKVRVKYQSKKSLSNKPSGDENIHNSEAVEIEAINEQIRQECDKQLVNGSGILSTFSTHILKACDSNHTELKNSAANTLIKFMMVSSSFCEKKLPVFLNLIENTDNMEMSIDLVSGFGWLIFRHPNLLEPSTDKLYARLRDKCAQVRFSTLMTIIDLIRQEMVKVRSQIAGIAKLIVDEDEKIKYTSKKLFEVIAEKGNTLYNVISDIISILSNPEDLVPEDDFQAIIKFLLPLITKERQIESLVDKLCIRLKEATNDVQAYYISYCLMIIKYNDKSLTKLSDNINAYTDKLKNPKVYNNFNILISNNSRMVKPATKIILSELISKIEKIVEDEEFAVAVLSQKTPGKRLTTIKKKPPKSMIKESPENEMEPLQEVTKRSARCRSKVKRKLLAIDSDEEENNEKHIQTRSVSKNTKLVDIKSNKNNKIDDDTVNVLKYSTRRNISENTRKKKLRHES